MTLLSMIILLVLVGMVMLLINNYIPMDAGIKKLLNILVIVVVILYVLSAIGAFGTLGSIRIGR